MELLLYYGSVRKLTYLSLATDIKSSVDKFKNERVVALDHDFKNRRIFFSDNKKNVSRIGVMKLDGSGQRELYIGELSRCYLGSIVFYHFVLWFQLFQVKLVSFYCLVNWLIIQLNLLLLFLIRLKLYQPTELVRCFFWFFLLL